MNKPVDEAEYKKKFQSVNALYLNRLMEVIDTHYSETIFQIDEFNKNKSKISQKEILKLGILKNNILELFKSISHFSNIVNIQIKSSLVKLSAIKPDNTSMIKLDLFIPAFESFFYNDTIHYSKLDYEFDLNNLFYPKKQKKKIQSFKNMDDFFLYAVFSNEKLILKDKSNKDILDLPIKASIYNDITLEDLRLNAITIELNSFEGVEKYQGVAKYILIELSSNNKDCNYMICGNDDEPVHEEPISLEILPGNITLKEKMLFSLNYEDLITLISILKNPICAMNSLFFDIGNETITIAGKDAGKSSQRANAIYTTIDFVNMTDN